MIELLTKELSRLENVEDQSIVSKIINLYKEGDYNNLREHCSSYKHVLTRYKRIVDILELYTDINFKKIELGHRRPRK